MTSSAGTSQRRGTDTETTVPDRAVAQVRAWLAAKETGRTRLGERVLNRALTTDGGLRYLTELVDSLVLPEDPAVAAAALRRARGQARHFLPTPLVFGLTVG